MKLNNKRKHIQTKVFYHRFINKGGIKVSIEMITGLVIFCFVSSITPGPNNLMLLSSGINFGLKRSLGHVFGVALGFTAMVILVGIGVSKLFELFPVSYLILKYVSVAYLCYLAYKIATSAELSNSEKKSKPITFMQAVLFQWINPKAWTMALSANAIYAPDQSLNAVLLVAMVFLICNLPSITVWLVAGKGLKTFLSEPKKLRVFNWLMASLLIISFIPSL